MDKATMTAAREAISRAQAEEERRCEARCIGGGKQYGTGNTFVAITSWLLSRRRCHAA